MMDWSTEKDLQFKAALLWFPESDPNRWEEIAEEIGCSKEMVLQRYEEMFQEVHQIESNTVQPPDQPSNSRPSSFITNYQPPEGKKVTSWTLKEHTLFLLGVERYGWGKWKDISKKAVVTRDAIQVGSHAQKYKIRQSDRDPNVKRRASIHNFTLKDFNSDYVNHLLSSNPHLMPHSSCSSVHHHPSLPMNQIASDVQSYQYTPSSSIHHAVQLNQHSSPIMMNQVGSQILSHVQVQNPYHASPSSVHYVHPNPQTSTMMMDQVGVEVPSNVELQNPFQANSSSVHYAVQSNHQSSAMMMNQGEPHIPSVGLESPPRNQIHCLHSANE